MSELKHTPGSWFLRTDNPRPTDFTIRICTQPKGACQWVCELPQMRNISEFGKARDIANARLIAAAPDMLEALLEIRKHANEANPLAAHYDIDHITAICNAAIVTATK